MFDILKLLAVATVAGIGWAIGTRVGDNVCDYVADEFALPRRLVSKCADMFRSSFGREPTKDELSAIAKAAAAAAA